MKRKMILTGTVIILFFFFAVYFAVYFGFLLGSSYQVSPFDHNAFKDISSHFKSYERVEGDFVLPPVSVRMPSGDVGTVRFDDRDYTLLNIWATWCSPCVAELPALQALHNVFAGGNRLQVLAISIDTVQKSSDIQGFTENLAVSDVANYHDVYAQLQRGVPLSGVPMTLIINRQGEVLYIIKGEADWGHQDIVDFFKYLVR